MFGMDIFLGEYYWEYSVLGRCGGIKKKKRRRMKYKKSQNEDGTHTYTRLRLYVMSSLSSSSPNLIAHSATAFSMR